MTYLTVIHRLNGEVVYVENAPQDKSFAEVEEIVNSWKPHSTKEYEIVQDKKLYEVVNYFKYTRELRWQADKRDWQDLRNDLRDISETLDNIEKQVYNQIDKFNSEE